MPKLIALLLMAALPLSAASAKQSGAVGATATPTPGNAQYKAIVAAAIKRIERNMTRGIGFKVDRIVVRNGWAFLDGVPYLRNGKPLDGTKYFDDAYRPSDGLQTQATLRFVGRKWIVQDLVTGAKPEDQRTWYCGDTGPALDAVICPKR